MKIVDVTSLFQCRLRRVLFACSAIILSGASIDAHAEEEVPKCHLQKFATFQLAVHQDKHTVGGEINGVPATFILDTGATQTLLMPESVKKFDLAPGHLDQTTAGVSGVAREYYVRLQSFSVGNLKSGHRNVVLIEKMAFKPEFDGIIGVDILFQHDLEFNLAANQVNFFQTLGCAATHLAYWDSNAPSVAFQKIGARDFRDVIEIQINGRKVRALLDTGARRSVMTTSAAALLGVSKDSPDARFLGYSGGAGGSHQVSMWEGRFDHVVIGGETVDNARLLIGDVWEAARQEANGGLDTDTLADVIMGEDFFMKHRLLFSESQRRLYFTFNGGELFGSPSVTVHTE